jgi:hypothetical protein
MLRRDGAFLRALARHLLVYALGRGLDEGDQAALERLEAALRREPTLPRLIEEIVLLDAFRLRRAAGAEKEKA